MPVTRSQSSASRALRSTFNTDTPASPSTNPAVQHTPQHTAVYAPPTTDPSTRCPPQLPAAPPLTQLATIEAPVDRTYAGTSVSHQHSKTTAVNQNVAADRTRKTRTSRRSNKQKEITRAKEDLAAKRMEEAKAATALAQARLTRLEAESSSSSEEEIEEAVNNERVKSWLDSSHQALQEAGVLRPQVPPVAVEQHRSAPNLHHDAEAEPYQAQPMTSLNIAGASPQSIELTALASAISKAAQSAARPGAPPKYLQELPMFNGASEEWLHYKAAFRDTADFFSPTENVARLRRSLRGTAKEAVHCLFIASTDPETVMKMLENRFGRPETLVLAEVDKMRALTKLSDTPRDICIFASKVANIVATVQALNRYHYLYNPELVKLTIEKLTPTLRFRWYDFACDQSDKEPDLVKMSRFLDREADRCSHYAQPEVIKPEKEALKRTGQRAFLIQEDQKGARTKPSSSSPRPISCPACKKDHRIAECPTFKDATTDERWDIAKRLRLCFRCLRVRHRAHTCKAIKCGTDNCQFSHHRLLHSTKKPQQIANITDHQDEQNAIVTSVNIPKTPRAFLKIVPVTITGNKGSAHTYALLDEGSTVTLIDGQLAHNIGATGPTEPFVIETVAGTRVDASTSKRVTFKIKGQRSHLEHEIEARTLDRLKLSPQTVDRATTQTCDHLADIADQLEYTGGSPTILIGQDNWALTVSRDIRAGPRHLPVASLTKLGWVLHGYRSSATAAVHFVNSLMEPHEDSIETIEKLVKDHFALESLGVQPRQPRNNEETRALTLLEEHSRRLPDGRFETALLWKNDEVRLPPSYSAALKRLHNLERKLDKNDELKAKYEAQIQNLLDNGYAELASNTPTTNKTWYLPHFAVINPSKPKIRVVHDAAAKTQGTCLNSHLLTGPDLLQPLPGVLMRFRQKPVAVSADIKEMFLQIRIRKEDRDALRFLWRGNRREGPPTEYRMTSVIFGAASSPCTAIFIKNKNAETFRHESPTAVDGIIRHHYMDDYLQSFDTTNEAAETAVKVSEIHARAKFHIQKWVSNERTALQHLATADRQTTKVNLDREQPEEKILGLVWRPQDDVLSFNLNLNEASQNIMAKRKRATKREVLRVAMSVFDPLGLATPITIQAKHILQELWRRGSDWDEEIDDELQNQWQEWLTEVKHLGDVSIPRCYPQYSTAVATELHTFVDASEKAYTAAVYWRCEQQDGTVRVHLVAAKGRVAPLKLISIPRLELQAAVLGSRLAGTVETEHDRKPSRRYFWSDSKTVLSWIRAGHRPYKTFVAHRIAEIEDLTKTNEWRWVASTDNVADDATRSAPNNFNINHRWFSGPEFLYLEKEHWPQEDDPTPEITGEERVLTTTTPPEALPLPEVNRFSSWLRLIRATARVLQFIELCRVSKATTAAARKRTKKAKEADPTWKNCPKPKAVKTTSRPREKCPKNWIPLEARHMQSAERLWLQQAQRDSFTEEIEAIKRNKRLPKNSRLSALSLVMENGLLHLKSRINEAEGISSEQKQPIVADGKHPYCRLYIEWIHRKLHHAGAETVVNEVRQRLWMIRLRTTARGVTKGCLSCRIRKAKPPRPSTGDHPKARLGHHCRPFTYTGLDYFGPLSVTVGRQHHKRYVALFTCLTTRALHLEIAASLTAASAAMALRRMIARRGCPTEIYSDNATNFHGADAQLRREALDATKEEATNRSIRWRFIPAGAPFMGGAWERLVQSVKRALNATLDSRHPTEEVLATLLAEVENSVNSRPLTHVSTSPDEPEALTPNHFLLGGSPNIQALGTFDDADLIRRDDWRKSQRLADCFWQRWTREYLPTLQQRQDPHSSGDSIKMGDNVVIVYENLPRNTWPKGRIIALHPGKDGVTRVVDVQTQGGIMRRPAKKIVVLPK